MPDGGRHHTAGASTQICLPRSSARSVCVCVGGVPAFCANAAISCRDMRNGPTAHLVKILELLLVPRPLLVMVGVKVDCLFLNPSPTARRETVYLERHYPVRAPSVRLNVRSRIKNPRILSPPAPCRSISSNTTASLKSPCTRRPQLAAAPRADLSYPAASRTGGAGGRPR